MSFRITISNLLYKPEQTSTFTILDSLFIKANLFLANNCKRTIISIFIPKLNSQHTPPTAVSPLLFLFHVHTSLARTQYTLFEHVSSCDDLAKRVGFLSLSQGHLEHSLVDVRVECLAELAELEVTCRSIIEC